MASGAENAVGNGYVLIKPTLDDGAISSLEAKGATSGKGFGTAFSVAAGNLIASAVQKLGAVVADTFSQAFNNYANYEQLVGGVDTLFKESSDIVQKNAANAFKTAGMSANEYMEQVTSFSASLLQGLGGDTKKAAEYADMAVRDMSDNANKMGTDIGRITDAYQGFAKQNYTMLDNLKLGYGGTKSEMERLLADASKIAGVEFNIDNYNDVIEAIHVMQENMGIAGTTAEEAEHTISGSISQLSASWNNFLTGLFDENADIGALGEQLFSSIGTVLRNIVPRIGVLIQRLILGLPQAIIASLQAIPEMLAPAITELFGEQIGGQINSALGDAFGGMAETLQELFAALLETMAALWEAVQPIVTMLGELFAAVMPIITEAISAVVGFITDEVLPLVQEIAEIVQPVIEQIAASVQEFMPQVQEVIDSAMSAIKGIIETVWPHIRDVIIGAVKIVMEIIERVWPIIATIIQGAMAVIQGIIETVWPIIQGIIETVSSAIQAVTETVWPVISGIIETAADAIMGAIEGIEAAVDVVRGIFDAIKSAIEDPIGTAQRFLEDAINTIRGLFDFDIEWPHIPLPHFNVWGSPNPLDWLKGNTPGFSIDWYAKGGFVDGATLIGAGEAGPEMILPQQGALMNDFADKIAQRIGGGVDIHDCTFNVRHESDIRKVAYELNMLINRQTAGGLA